MKKRLGIISFFVVLMVAAISVFSYSYEATREAASTKGEIETLKKGQKTGELGLFRQLNNAEMYQAMPKQDPKNKTLEEYYENRALYGSPPTIPHQVTDQRNMGGKSCLKCHQNGGYVAKYDAYASITPHPDKVNCRQCHVPVTTKSEFRKSTLEKFKGPKLNNAALITSPPPIPHPLNLRMDCLSCHAGDNAPKEIQFNHPERVNCRQCHALNDKTKKDIGEFESKLHKF